MPNQDYKHAQCTLLYIYVTKQSWNQTLGKIGKRVWEIGWGGSVHCAQNAGALPIGS